MRTTAGIELDGTTATLAVTSDGSVESVRTISGAAPAEALSRAAALIRPGDPVRVVLVDPGVWAARLDVTADLLTRSRFTAEAYRATGAPREGTTAAALVHDQDGVAAGRLVTGLAVIAPAGPVEEVYAQLSRGRQVEVVATAATAAALDGVSVAVRTSAADISLVQGGQVIAHTQLRTGGLGVPEGVLGAGEHTGAARLTAAMSRQGADPIAAAEADRYVRALAEEVRGVLDGWTRTGARVPAQVLLHGRSTTGPLWTSAFADVDLSVGAPEPLRQLTNLAPGERPAALTAFLAATGYGTGAPYAAFVDPAAERAAVLAARRAARRRARAVALTCAGLLAGGLLAPVSAGHALSWWTTSQADRAEDALASTPAGPTLLGEQRLAGLEETLAGRDALARQATQAILETVPSGVALTGVTSAGQSADGATVSLVADASLPADEQAAVAAWSVALRERLPDMSVSLGDFARTRDRFVFELRVEGAR